jgi:Ca-activated chloride channel family protein
MVVPHLLRPFWLLALIALPLLWWLRRRHAIRETPWRHEVDAHLLPSLLQAAPAATQRIAWLFGTAFALLVFALAGPSWRQQPAPLYAPAAPLVVVMDASSHMLAADQPPSRLLRARLKIEQLIAARKGGQIGLVAYAGDAFTVAPLSDDANNLRDLLAALAPDTMPVDGQRADRAIRRATDLLAQAGYTHGQILVLSDGADALAQAAARDALAKGYSVDAIGVGTASGAPLPALDGTFAQDAGGVMQVARLDADALRALAQAGSGRYAPLSADTSDLAALGVLDSHGAGAVHRGDAPLRWRDDGPFLLLALLPLVALGFRRGWLSIVFLAVLAMPVQRASATDANWWNALWQRADQRADHALRSGDAATAGVLAQTPDQRAAAAYRAGDYAAASRGWMQRDNADANYNRGNALTKMQQYPQAIEAYRRALQQRPGMKDAQDNLRIVEQLLKQKQREEKKQQQGEPQKNQQQQNQQDQQQGQAKQDQDGQSKSQENMQKSQQQGQQRNQQQGQDQKQQKQQGRQGKDQQQQVQAQQPAPDREKQAQADAAEQRALQQALSERKKDDANALRAAVAKETAAQREQREATEALLQRVPDDPGGLLRRKFALEYARRQQEGEK